MRSTCGTFVGFFTALITFLPSAMAFRIVSFDGEFTRWDTNEISYSLDSRGSDDFEEGCDSAGPCVSVRDVIRASFQTWQNVDGTTIRFAESKPAIHEETGYDDANAIVWVEKGWTALSFSPPTNALAVTITTYKTSNKEIVDADIHFNGEYFRWGVIDTPEEEGSDIVDIQNIATHEIGHFIGLDHSSDDIFESVAKFYGATMYFASGPGDMTRRALKEDDVDAAHNLYPAADYGDPEVSSITPDAVDTRSGAGITMTVSGGNFLPFTSVSIVAGGDMEDIAGRVLSVSDDRMTVAFDLTGLTSGAHDVLIANSYDNKVKLSDGFTVGGGLGSANNGGSSSLGSESSGGGCAAKGLGSVPSFGMLFGFLIAVLAALGVRARQVRAHSQSEGRARGKDRLPTSRPRLHGFRHR